MSLRNQQRDVMFAQMVKFAECLVHVFYMIVIFINIIHNYVRSINPLISEVECDGYTF